MIKSHENLLLRLALPLIRTVSVLFLYKELTPKELGCQSLERVSPPPASLSEAFYNECWEIVRILSIMSLLRTS